MTRKPLPRAITRPMAGLRGIAADFVADEQGRVPREIHDAVEPEPPLAPARAPAPAVPRRSDPLAARRKALARKIVERHKLYAAVGGLSPLPVLNIAGVTAVIMRMVRQLSALYQVPFQRDRTRATIIGLMGGAVPTGLGTATASTLMLVVPASALVGIGVSAISAGALARAIGLVFIESFESGVPERN